VEGEKGRKKGIRKSNAPKKREEKEVFTPVNTYPVRKEKREGKEKGRREKNPHSASFFSPPM